MPSAHLQPGVRPGARYGVAIVLCTMRVLEGRAALQPTEANRKKGCIAAVC